MFPSPRYLAASILLSAGSLAHGSEDTSVQSRERSGLETIIVHGTRLETWTAPAQGTATRFALSSLETPQSVSVLTRDMLDDFGLDSVNEALEAATGIHVEQVETDRTYYTARGFDITNFQADGIGLPLTYGNVEGALDTALYERIEIVRGANGLMSGAGNPSATINLVRKRPLDTLTGSVRLSGGSWNAHRLEADLAAPITDGVRARAVLAREQSDSWLDDYALEKNVAYGVVDARIGKGGTLTAGISHHTSEADSPLWGALPMYYTDGSPTNFDQAQSTSADWAYWDSRESAGFLELEQELGDHWIARAVYQHARINGDSELFYMYGTPEPFTNTGMTGYASAYDLDDRKDMLDLYVQGTHELLQRPLEIVAGLAWSRAEVTDVSLYDYTTGAGFPAIGDLSQWHGDALKPVFADGRDGSDWDDEQAAVYAALRLQATEALSLIAGLRVVDWQSEGISYGEPQDADENGKSLPYAGAVYRFGANYSIYASHTTTFMPQYDLDAAHRRLDPSQGTNTEAGLKAEWFDKRLIASLALFDATHEGVSEYVYFDPATASSVYQGADYESRGYEIELVGEPTAGLLVSVGYTDLSIEDSAGAEARNYVPRRLLRAAGSYRPSALPALQLGASWSWQDEVSRDQGITTTRQDAYGLLNVFAAWQFTPRLEGSLHVANLTDEKYLNSLFWDQAYYGAPRNAQASIDWRF